MFPKIDQGRILNAVSATPEIDLVTVGFQNLLFGKGRFYLKGDQQFLDFADPFSFERKKKVFGKLLGDRASTLGDPHIPDILEHGSCQANMIDPAVTVKPPPSRSWLQ